MLSLPLPAVTLPTPPMVMVSLPLPAMTVPLPNTTMLWFPPPTIVVVPNASLPSAYNADPRPQRSLKSESHPKQN